ncbi:metalloregulator ArsR/SmtB family transcription factor [Aquincola tertiaricarbonis]|uniref:Metalloregulator ArsR/SmtB family transcription factor n=1 Tax=Aquincola tertiaricarbonis TaxID=391953 RepID=A0ABY4SG00_AQUTE|nr:metalloregulator ArsR/SmtB family transcription factor [Aquincola tertiaricarbonis]URI10698.1 metalloregulator ArsR/SmtB family transcription factor [Aquincola tertiaricarbonis]
MTTTDLLDHTMTALADATRRAILRRLARGEARVTELAAPFAISLNSVSKHIRILERAQLVQRRVVGREHLLSFNPAPLAEAGAWIHEQQAFWSQRLDALEAALLAEDASAAAASAPAPAPEPVRKKARRPARGPSR